MGATTTLLYGLNLLMTPVYDPIPIEEGSVPEVALVDHRYHIRVLVPCYKESLELVQRTVTAALDAQLPKGTKWSAPPTPEFVSARCRADMAGWRSAQGVFRPAWWG